MTVEENKHVVGRAFDAFMSGDFAPLEDLLSKDCTLHQCGFPEPIRGADMIRGFARGGRLSDRQVRLDRMVGEGDLVAIHWQTSGHVNDAGAEERAGKEVSFPSMTFLRLEGKKIAEIWNIQDVATLQTQLSSDG